MVGYVGAQECYQEQHYYTTKATRTRRNWPPLEGTADDRHYWNTAERCSLHSHDRQYPQVTAPYTEAAFGVYTIGSHSFFGGHSTTGRPTGGTAAAIPCFLPSGAPGTTEQQHRWWT